MLIHRLIDGVDSRRMLVRLLSVRLIGIQVAAGISLGRLSSVEWERLANGLRLVKHLFAVHTLLVDVALV